MGHAKICVESETTILADATIKFQINVSKIFTSPIFHLIYVMQTV